MKNKVFFLLPFFIVSNLLSEVIYRVPIQGTIDLGLPPFIKRVLMEAETNKASAVIFDINTFGGRVDAATQIKDAILAYEKLKRNFPESKFLKDSDKLLLDIKNEEKQFVKS